jgi:PBP1b-binding outer membrane lipoprotein LpoB
MRLIKILLLVLTTFFITGCGEEYMAGVTTGVIIQKVATQEQDKLIAVTDLVVERRESLEAELAETEKAFVITPDMATAVKNMNGREKDPFAWIALVEALGLATWLGKSIKGIKPPVKS